MVPSLKAPSLKKFIRKNKPTWKEVKQVVPRAIKAQKKWSDRTVRNVLSVVVLDMLRRRKDGTIKYVSMKLPCMTTLEDVLPKKFTRSKVGKAFTVAAPPLMHLALNVTATRM